MVDGSPVPYGDLAAVYGTLTGTLTSGDAIDNIFYQGGFDGGGEFVATGTIRLVPEPETALLLVLGLTGLAVGGRRSGAGLTLRRQQLQALADGCWGWGRRPRKERMTATQCRPLTPCAQHSESHRMLPHR
jgi:hypothetical protein